jgi:hypothetical protein
VLNDFAASGVGGIACLCSVSRRLSLSGGMRLDEEKVEALRSWGERLGQSSGEESRAVGRAILMLVEEIDQLHIELWHGRLQASVSSDSSPTTEGERSVDSSLGRRLHRVLRPHRGSPAPEPLEQPESATQSGRSVQAWIDALRHQK